MKTYSKGTGTPWRTTTDLGERGKEGEGVLVSERNVDDSVMGEGRDRVESSNFLPTTLPTGGNEKTGVFPRESTGSPETTGGVDERFPLGREVSVTGGDTEEESIVRFQDFGSDDGIGGLRSSIHLLENLFGKSLSDPDARNSISIRPIAQVMLLKVMVKLTGRCPRNHQQTQCQLSQLQREWQYAHTWSK